MRKVKAKNEKPQPVADEHVEPLTETPRYKEVPHYVIRERDDEPVIERIDVSLQDCNHPAQTAVSVVIQWRTEDDDSLQALEDRLKHELYIAVVEAMFKVWHAEEARRNTEEKVADLRSDRWREKLRREAAGVL